MGERVGERLVATMAVGAPVIGVVRTIHRIHIVQFRGGGRHGASCARRARTVAILRRGTLTDAVQRERRARERHAANLARAAGHVRARKRVPVRAAYVLAAFAASGPRRRSQCAEAAARVDDAPVQGGRIRNGGLLIAGRVRSLCVDRLRAFGGQRPVLDLSAGSSTGREPAATTAGAGLERSIVRPVQQGAIVDPTARATRQEKSYPNL